MRRKCARMEKRAKCVRASVLTHHGLAQSGHLGYVAAWMWSLSFGACVLLCVSCVMCA